MRNLLNPKWLYVINTLPLIILFVLLFNQFNIIKPLLNDRNIRLCEFFGLTLGILTVLNFIYTLYLTITKRKVSVIYGIIALLCYVTFLYVYEYYSGETIPFNIPQWMLSENVYLYVGTFLMPTIAYSLFILIVRLTPNAENRNALTDFLIVLLIPLVGYLFTLTLLPLWQNVESNFNGHVVLIILISLTLIFLFFLVRIVFILVSKKSATLQKYKLAWKIPIAIILPILGLMVNNGYLFNHFTYSNSGIFGNFNNLWFFILAIINGVLICLPNIENKTYRLFLFVGRFLTFSYTLYFFLVLLPFLPFSLIAIIIVGMGFLMLTPLMLFVIHINELSTDFKYLKTFLSTKLIITIASLGFLVIPIIISTIYLRDKFVLNKTLEYLYTPNYSKQYNINKKSLASTLDVIKNHLNKSNQDFFEDSQIPFMSSYYNWLVLDNLTLSDAKIGHIEKVFFGNNSYVNKFDNNPNNNTEISKISTKSIYDKSQNAWKSWVDLEIINRGDNSNFGEYLTTIDLPNGCWISDYYLYVGNKKEKGLLAEKKSAMWIFSNIKNENKDPGILYYLTGNKVAFRVFPFSTNEVRKTGIEFLHKEPIKLYIDDYSVELGNKDEGFNQSFENENVAYITAQQKKSLKQVERKPYFHFIVDASKGKRKLSANFIKQIENTTNDNKSLSVDAKISFVNTYTKTVNLNNNWKEQYKSQNFEGGFFLDRAFREELIKSYKNKSYPIFVVVTDSIRNAVLENDFSDLKFIFPESSSFYNLVQNKLEAHSLLYNPLVPISDSLFSTSKTVLEYKLSDNSIVYLPNDNKPSIVLKKDNFNILDNEMIEKNWQSALSMQAKHISNILHPEKSEKQWLKQVKHSFMTKVMIAETSYLVVENEAQKNVLKKKQEQVLSGKKSLDLNEDTPRMSEPSLWILLILFALLIWYKEKKTKHLHMKI